MNSLLGDKTCWAIKSPAILLSLAWRPFSMHMHIYGAVDSSQLTLLALFDVSAAFDTVDHEILLKRLEISFGLSGNFLSWVGSFLSERSLCVVHGPSRSAWV